MKREPFATAAGMKWRRHRALALLGAGLVPDTEKGVRGSRQVASAIVARLAHGESALSWSIDDLEARGTMISTLDRQWFEDALNSVPPRRRSLAIRSSTAVDGLDAWLFFETDEEAKALRKEGWTFWVSARARDLDLPATPPLFIGYFEATAAEQVATQVAEDEGLDPAFSVAPLLRTASHCHIQILCDRSLELAREHASRASSSIGGSSCDLCVVVLKEGLPERARTRALLELRDTLGAGGLIVGKGEANAALGLMRTLTDGLTEETPLWQLRFKTQAEPAVLLCDQRLASHRLSSWTPLPAWEEPAAPGGEAPSNGAAAPTSSGKRRFPFFPGGGTRPAGEASPKGPRTGGWGSRQIRSGPKRGKRGSAPMAPTRHGVADSFGKTEGAPEAVSGSDWFPAARASSGDEQGRGGDVAAGKPSGRGHGSKPAARVRAPKGHHAAGPTQDATPRRKPHAPAETAPAAETSARDAEEVLAAGDEDAAIAAVETDGGPTLVASADAGTIAVRVALEAADVFATACATAIADVARDPAEYEGLRAPGTAGLLRELARKGGALRCALTHSDELPPRPPHVEVVSVRPETIFPAEYLYALEPPDADAPLCDRADEGVRADRSQLAGGWCPGCTPTARPAEEQSHAVCPLAFWGASCVIEHLWEDGDGADVTHGTGRSDRMLHPLHCALLGVTDRVDGSVAETIAQRLGASTGTLVTAEDWSDWEYYIKREPAPTMLALVAHAKLDARSRAPQLEIGMASTLNADAVRPTHVRSSEDVLPPVAVLLGAGTGLADAAFEGFASAIEAMGAIVISTIAPIPGDDAALVVDEIVAAIRRAQGPVPLIDIITDARRKLLADGTPALLSLVALGEATAAVDATV